MTAVLAAFLLSGASALVYQVAWQRLLVLQSGVSIYSVAMIVASFMAGLGIGNALGGVASTRLSPARALLGFAAMEAGIAIFGAASSFLYHDVLYLRAAWLYAEPWRVGLLHFAGLLLPTALMGASLPLLTRGSVQGVEGASRTIGVLYAVNTLGAAAGAVATPWLLIRHLGVTGAVQVAAVGNLLAALLALSARGSAPEASALAPLSPRRGGAPPLWLGLYALSGFVALSLEILWFRLVETSAKATAFTFGTVLALYLAGLGVGTLLGNRLLPRVRRPLDAFLTCQCALLLWSGLAVSVLVWLPNDLAGMRWLYRYWGATSVFKLGFELDAAALLALYLGVPLLLYGVPTLLMGVSFPILQRAVQDDPQTAGRKVGGLQAANIAGCVAGSLVTGLWLLDRLGTPGSLSALLVLGLAFAVVGLARSGQPARFIAFGVALVASAVSIPDGEALWRRLHGADEERAFVEEDATGVPVLRRVGPSRWHMSVNGVPHSVLPYGALHTALGALPALVHPQPLQVAIIGLGSGDTAWAAGLWPSTERVRVFEICRPQLALLHRVVHTSAPADGLRQLLGDPRVEIRFADGRSALEHESQLYDVIELDALHPYSAYSGHLYSLDFYSRAARRLKPGGLMATWSPTPQVHAAVLQALPHAVAFGPLLLAGRDPIPFAPERWRERLESPESVTYLGLRLQRELREQLRRARPAEASQALPNTDMFPRDEFGMAGMGAR